MMHGHMKLKLYEDIDMDILEIYNTILPIPTLSVHNTATPAPHPYMSEPLYPY